jgi:hypothetical protein
MTVQLVPVLEIRFNSIDAPVLDRETLMQYSPGLHFYRISSLSVANLIEVVGRHTEALRKAEYAREGASALFGGYVLKVEGKDVYFPQCCGDLSDIRYWEQLVTARLPFPGNGHPAPKVLIMKHRVKFDFAVDQNDENFVPAPALKSIEISKEELRVALSEAKVELIHFAQKLNKINEEQAFGIEDIEKLLIWGDS